MRRRKHDRRLSKLPSLLFLAAGERRWIVHSPGAQSWSLMASEAHLACGRVKFREDESILGASERRMPPSLTPKLASFNSRIGKDPQRQGMNGSPCSGFPVE